MTWLAIFRVCKWYKRNVNSGGTSSNCSERGKDESKICQNPVIRENLETIRLSEEKSLIQT
jgi:hypothetical protein